MKMKKSLLLLALSAVALGAFAQDDDIYFVPTEKAQPAVKQVEPERSSYSVIPATKAEQQYDNWADNRAGWCDVDEYNRRGMSHNDSVVSLPNATESEYYGADDASDCTVRLVRFHSPRVGVIISSPYYYDYYNIVYDPWFDPWYDPWYGWGGWYGWYGYRPWYSHWYGWGPYYWGWSWGWHRPWHNTWAWHGGHRGWHGGGRHHGGWSGTYHATTRDREYQRGPVNGGRSFGRTTVNPRSNSSGSGSSVNRGIAQRRSFGTSSSSTSRSTGASRSSGSNSRSFGNSSSSSSRSYGGGGFSGGSRSGGGGGSRGGGRSFGR